MTNNETGKENDQERIFIQKLLSAIDVAEILGISAKTVNKLVRAGKLGCVQVTTKERRFTEQQVEGFVESRSSKLQIDRTIPDRVKSAAPKGGEKSLGVSKADLRKEMSLWR